MPPQPVRNPACSDFEYLCRACDAAGWLVGISVGGYVEKPRDGSPGRRTLSYLRLKRNATAPAKIAIPIGDDIALASRIALDQLLAQTKGQRGGP